MIRTEVEVLASVASLPYLGTLCAWTTTRRCQEDPVSLPSSRLEKTTRSSPHHVAQHRPTGSETTPPYAPWSSRFGLEPPSVEDNVDVWRYAILSCMPETMTTIGQCVTSFYIPEVSLTHLPVGLEECPRMGSACPPLLRRWTWCCQWDQWC